MLEYQGAKEALSQRETRRMVWHCKRLRARWVKLRARCELAGGRTSVFHSFSPESCVCPDICDLVGFPPRSAYRSVRLRFSLGLPSPSALYSCKAGHAQSGHWSQFNTGIAVRVSVTPHGPLSGSRHGESASEVPRRRISPTLWARGQ